MIGNIDRPLNEPLKSYTVFMSDLIAILKHLDSTKCHV